MPLGPADDKGTVLYYEDTGVPEGARAYTTLILVHGTMFNGAIFRRMYPYAASNNLRIVSVNKRDYVGSTPYTTEELSAVQGTAEEQKAIIDADGVRLAHFIAWFIETEKIPPILEAKDGTRIGGFALAGWSSGNVVTISLLGNANKLPETTREFLGSYFRTLVVYDLAARTGGELIDTGLRPAWPDPNVSPDERVVGFQEFVSAYFPSLTELPTDLAIITARRAVTEEGTSRLVTSVGWMTPEEVSSVIDAQAFLRSQIFITTADPSIMQQNVRRAILDCRFGSENGDEKVIWSELRVRSIWCDKTINDVLVWNWRVAELFNAERKLGHNGLRPLELLKFENANHFAHWDDAERFTKFIGGNI